MTAAPVDLPRVWPWHLPWVLESAPPLRLALLAADAATARAAAERLPGLLFLTDRASGRCWWRHDGRWQQAAGGPAP